MFSSSPMDRSCIGSDNVSSGRGNASRFPVPIPSLGDENQQIRIQLAVHKYNSSPSSPSSNRFAGVSSLRHSSLRNSLKNKSFESEPEATKCEKRSVNQYEGVGAFPTVHLKKSAVRYRPIKRFNDVKILYPELPVNRYFNHFPQVCSDIKSSTRSVLDVLEDLSGKKVHEKEENGSIRSKSRGLGGDYMLSNNLIYSPLFVQKPKISSVLTRDSTTQTLSVCSESPSPQSTSSYLKNDVSDPRAELRRKLAKQNNEIFASLSSSVSSFAFKRKIDKISVSKDDDNSSDSSTSKKCKLSDHQTENNGENGISKLGAKPKINTNSVMLKGKSKLNEPNSPTSPNKDRLTTIFLDMKDTSPKSQMFQNNTTKPAENTTSNIIAKDDVPDSAKSALKAPFSPILNGSSSTEPQKSETSFKTPSSVSEKPNSPEQKKEEQPKLPSFNFPVNSTTINTDTSAKPAIPTFQFGSATSNSSTSLNFSMPKTTTENNSKSLTESISKSTDGKEKENQTATKPFATSNFNTGQSNFSGFKFGEQNTTSAPTSFVTQTAVSVSTSSTTSTSVTPQFSFGTSNATSPTAPVVKFGVSSSENTFSVPAKPLFGFGQPSKTEDKDKSSVSSPVTKANETVANISKENSSTNSPVNNKIGSNIASPVSQQNTSFAPPGGLNFSSGSATQVANKGLFSFGQKTDSPLTTTTSSNTTSENKLSFTFGKKTDMIAPGTQGDSGQKSSLFSTNPSSVTSQPSSVAVTTSSSSASLPTFTQSSSVFGQGVSSAQTSTQITFGQTSSTQITNGFVAKVETTDAGKMPVSGFNPTSTSFSGKTPLFGSSTSMFGQTTTQASSASTTFGTTTTASTFKFGTSATQSTPTFGMSTTSQPTSTFGAVSTTLSVTGFGGTSTTQTTPAFGNTSSNTVSAFGSTTTSSTPTFGTTSTTSAPAFGAAASNSAPVFGTTSTNSAPVFGTNTSNSTSAFGTTVSNTVPTFGTTTSNSVSGFGTSTSTPAFGTAASNSNSIFGTSTANTVTGFGTSLANTTPAFGNTQTNSVFGVSSTPFSNTTFGSSTTTAPTFGSESKTTLFGASTASQPTPSFGGVSSTTQSGSLFGTSTTSSSTFGSSAPSTASFGSSVFGTPSSTQPITGFSNTVSQSNTAFGGTSFSSTPSQPSVSFGASSTAPTAFGSTQSTFNQPASMGQTPSIFGQTTTPNFSSGILNSNQNSPFGQKPSNESNIFDQNKSQTNAFGGSTQPFGTDNKFSFGMSTSNATGFTSSPPNTTSAPMFNFGSNSGGSTFTFGGSNTSASNNTQTPFAFGKTSTNELFKFGAAASKEGPGFGTPNSSTFTFGGQMNNNAPAEQKPAFNFSATPSPSVFSFGGSTSSASSGSGFSFGTPTPGAGAFGQPSTASPGAPFAVPGTFNIGSGSSQSRPRATSRPRRRP